MRDSCQESAGIYPRQRLKKTILVLSLLSLVVPTNSAEIHAWVDSAADEGYYWTIDTLYDSIQWTVREVNAQGYSSFPTGDTFVCWGKLKNPMPMRGTNQYYTINKIAPYIKDTIYEIMGWKWITDWRLSMSGDTAIVFRVLTDNSQIITQFIFSIQNSMLLGPLGPVSGVTDKTIQRPTINVSRSCRYFFANGRLAPCPEKLRNIGMIPNKIILH